METNMTYTASFTDVARNLTNITNRAVKDNIEVTVFKNNKPFFKIVPIAREQDTDTFLTKLDDTVEDYHDILEMMAHE